MDTRRQDQTLHLSGSIDVNEIQSLQQLLASEIDTDQQSIQLDLSEVDAIDLDALQVLLSAKKTSEIVDKIFKITAMSAPVHEALSLTGLLPLFAPPQYNDYPERGQILVVDDSSTLRLQVRQILEEHSYTVIESQNGLEALSWLLSGKVHQLPDVIILDRNMPVMEGDECIRVLKGDRTWRRIPVLFLTAQHTVNEVVYGLSHLGADDYLSKPFDPRELVARIKVLVRIKQAEDQLQEALYQQKMAFEELQKTQILLAETEALASMTKVFEKFVPQQFLSRVAKKGIDSIQLGTVESETVTTLFSDIRDFTKLSESMTPEEVFKFLNLYLSYMTTPIEAHGGFIDKYIGDAIMALFDQGTIQEQVHNAIQAAIEMQHILKKYNGCWEGLGNLSIRVGSGIHVGNVMIGTLGHENRMDSTAIGDSVNTAARLESLTKYYRSPIIISEEIFEQLQTDQFICRHIDLIYIKGKQQPTRIYEVLNSWEGRQLELKQALLPKYIEAFSLYQAQKWQEAIRVFTECLHILPEDYPTQMMIDRCHDYMGGPFLEGWSGVYQMRHK